MVFEYKNLSEHEFKSILAKVIRISRGKFDFITDNVSEERPPLPENPGLSMKAQIADVEIKNKAAQESG